MRNGSGLQRWQVVLVAMGFLAVGIAAAAGPEDEALASRARARIQASSDLDGASVDVACLNGVVTLSGTVDTLAQAWKARELAGKVSGVRKVDVRLQVRSAGASDGEINSEILRRIANTPELADKELQVDVQNGEVRLSGTLPDARLRFVARRVVSEVPGVTGIVDAVTTPAAPDKVIAQEVTRALGRRSLTGLVAGIKSAVKDGVVTLEGSVPDPLTRRQAEEIVLGINGVRRVINHIEVRPKMR